MKTIDRYLVREYLHPFFYSLIAFLVLYVVLDFFASLDDILAHQVSWQELRNYYLAFLPIIFVQISPLAVLLATLYTLGIFNRNNEITAVKAAGVSVYRLALPLVILGLLTGVFSFWISETVVPRASVITTMIKQERIKNDAPAEKEKIFKNVTLYGTKNRMYYLGTYNVEEKSMTGVTILQQGADNSVETKISAPSASWEEDHWVFHDAAVSHYEKNNLRGKPEKFPTLILEDAREKPEDFAVSVVEDVFLSSRTLKREIARLSVGGYLPIRKIVDWHCRFAYPLTNLIIILIGVPFALGIKKGGALVGIGFSLVIGLVFYEVNYLSIALGKGGSLPPFLSAWLANLIFSGVGLVLLARTPK